MASEVIPCPSCRHDVRVPESLFGQPVRCPACKAYFTAPTRDSQGILGNPELLTEPPPLVRAANSPPPEVSQSSIFLPAVLLLLVGIIGTLVSGVGAARALNDPEAAKRAQLEAMKQVFKALQVEFPEDLGKDAGDSLIPVLIAAFVVSVLPLAGAIAMLKTRYWWLALTGSFFAVINFSNCCCAIGAPVGIYCLIKLFDPQIRMLFRRE